jgi:hypothetical protein
MFGPKANDTRVVATPKQASPKSEAAQKFATIREKSKKKQAEKLAALKKKSAAQVAAKKTPQKPVAVKETAPPVVKRSPQKVQRKSAPPTNIARVTTKRNRSAQRFSSKSKKPSTKAATPENGTVKIYAPN